MKQQKVEKTKKLKQQETYDASNYKRFIMFQICLKAVDFIVQFIVLFGMYWFST